MSKVKMPTNGIKIEMKNNKLEVPDNPIIPFIEGDGHEDWMRTGDDNEKINRYLRIYKTIQNLRDNRISSMDNAISNTNQVNDTWRPGACHFACENYREGLVGQWLTDAPLTTIEGSKDIAKEMRDRCNKCLGYRTIE